MTARPSPCRCDNDGTVLQSANVKSDKRSLYMKRRKSFVQEAQLAGETELTGISSANNRADILTKALDPKLFKRMRGWLMAVERSVRGVHAHVFRKGT